MLSHQDWHKACNAQDSVYKTRSSAKRAAERGDVQANARQRVLVNRPELRSYLPPDDELIARDLLLFPKKKAAGSKAKKSGDGEEKNGGKEPRKST